MSFKFQRALTITLAGKVNDLRSMEDYLYMHGAAGGFFVEYVRDQERRALIDTRDY